MTTNDPELGAEQTPVDTDVQDSNPNAGGPQGLQGGMGISSERTGPFGGSDPADSGVQGTGSHGSAAKSTEGTAPTSRAGADQLREHTEDPAEGENGPGGDVPREHSEDAAEGPDDEGEIDRTVGEANTAEVPSQRNDPAKNPGHSHGT